MELSQLRFKAADQREVLISMITALGRAFELKDEYTANHQHQVSDLCVCIAETMGLSNQMIEGLRIGAAVHDVGKLAVPSEILANPRKLTPIEFKLIQQHSQAGADVFKGIKMPWPIEDMIRQHHERMDGSGYPLGLQRSEICIEARIIAVADTFDSMTNDRPYRAALGVEKAIEVIKQGRGSVFDSYVVDAFLECSCSSGATAS
jgi:HD-GYP domain-containing protein (c-di-GMP phosphodiesterase class II)